MIKICRTLEDGLTGSLDDLPGLVAPASAC